MQVTDHKWADYVSHHNKREKNLAKRDSAWSAKKKAMAKKIKPAKKSFYNSDGSIKHHNRNSHFDQQGDPDR